MSNIDVVIPTTATRDKAATIWRAIASVHAQSGVRAQAHVVVNGTSFDPGLVAGLRDDPRIRVSQLPEASMPRALFHGRQCVTGEYFAFLDDDDEFLIDGLQHRTAVLDARHDCAFVIANGVFNVAGVEQLVVSDARRIAADPLGTLADYNWICTSASGLYRASMVGPETFKDMPKYLEWTYLGFRLLTVSPFQFIEEPGYRKHELDSSLSRSAAFRQGMVESMQAVLALPLPAVARRAMRKKLSAAHHAQAQSELEAGRRSNAARHHFASLALPGGLRYLTFSRYLLLPTRAIAVRNLSGP